MPCPKSGRKKEEGEDFLKMELCKDGQRVAFKCRDVVVKRDGEVTDIYWHIESCEKCAELREKAK